MEKMLLPDVTCDDYLFDILLGTMGTLIALYEQVVRMHDSPVNISVYHQSGVDWEC